MSVRSPSRRRSKMLQRRNSFRGDNAVEMEFLSVTMRMCGIVARHWDDVTAALGLFFVVRWLVVK